MSNVFIPRETRAGEARAAATPETVKHMVAAGLSVTVERGAGAGAHIADQDFEAAGATLTDDRQAASGAARLVLRVTAPAADEVPHLAGGATLIALLAPHRELEVVRRLAECKVNALAMELVPRITRAQEMDALSSQASIAGYKAVCLAAYRLGKYFPLLMTAAGTIRPAKVVVMGAGVAGLQAIATAKRLGATVEVSDIREAVKEQVESLGARFIPLPELEESGEGEGGYARQMSEEYYRKQREIVARHVAAADVVISTALIPGKKAPLLITREMVEAMKDGAVIVDLAAGEGGNCELSQENDEVVHAGVLILGPTRLAAETAADATQLYARNVWALVKTLLDGEGNVQLDLEDEVVAAALLTHEGQIRHAATREKLEKEGVTS